MLHVISKMKVRTKLALLFLMFGLLPIVGILPSLLSGKEQLEEGSLQVEGLNAKGLVDIIDRNLFERYGDVQAFTLNSAVQNQENWRNVSSSNILIQSMNGYMTNYGIYKLMMFVDTNGVPQAINTIDAKGNKLNTNDLYGKTFQSEEWFKNAIDGKFLEGRNGLTGTAVQDPRFDSTIASLYGNDDYVIVFSAPVKNSAGNVIGVWVNFADFGLVEEIAKGFYQKVKAEAPGAVITVLDRQGTVLLDYDPSATGSEIYTRDKNVVGKLNLVQEGVAVAKEAVSGKSGAMVAMHSRKHIEMAAGYAHSNGAYDYPGLGWSVIVRVPADQAFDYIDKLSLTMAITFAVVIGVILVVGLFFGNVASRPIRQVGAAIAKLAKGQTTLELPKAGKDEIGDMIHALSPLKDFVEGNARVQKMIDTLSTLVMMCDKDFKINYANDASLKTLRTLEKYLPVSADKIVGSNIDIFHKNPSHQRNVLSTLGEKSHKTEIQIGPEWAELNATMLKDAQGNFAGAYIDWKVITETKRLAAEAARVQSMIDNLSVPVMLCDKEFKITYLNQISKTLLRKLESHLPVRVDELVGSCIDIFHKNPAHQRGVLSDPSKLPHEAKFEIGGEWLHLNANMLKNSKGEFDGAFINWNLITQEVHNEASIKLAQENINELINAAREGELDKRIDASQFQGFYKDLAESMNGLMDTIIEPITASIGTLTTFSEGDLTKQMEGEYKGSFGQIQRSLNGTIGQLKSMVTRIKESASSVNAASSEISAGSTDLSARTEQQASSLEETAASMEEITGTVRQNSENAGTANKLSADAKNVAERGGKVVTDAVEAMRAIEKSSQKIADIIGVIDEIAFQTNLLALNAAVEAARAGDAGKGFAVVASEVRSLAGRSASASKEIKTLISESAQQVESGAQLVNQAGETLKDIVSSVTQVADIISDIAAASHQQSSGIDEINSAVTQMDEMTQQNAALVEENTAAAQSLVHQANDLIKLMQFFTIDDEEGESSGGGYVAPALEAPKPVANVNKTSGAAKKPVTATTPKAKPASPAPKTAAKKGSSTGDYAEKSVVAGNQKYDAGWEEF